MRTKLIAGLVLALAIPSLALAAKPVPPPGKSGEQHGKAQPRTVLYVLKGSLSGYSAFTAPSTNGTISITVSKANHFSGALKGKTLSFVVDAKTKVALFQGATTVTNGDIGIVKVKVAKGTAATIMNLIQPPAPATPLNAFQVIDQHAAPTP